MFRPHRRRAAFSLLELLIVIVLIGIMAALVIPSVNPGVHERLRAGAEVIASDLAYARSLAVSNNSSYRVTFDRATNRYQTEHTGANSALDVLPPPLFGNSRGTPQRHVVALDDLPGMVGDVRLFAVGVGGPSPSPVGDVEFGPIGETTRSDETVIWLSAPMDGSPRFIVITVNPVSGLATIGEYQGTGPPAAIVAAL